jgi:hypothetical protein
MSQAAHAQEHDANRKKAVIDAGQMLPPHQEPADIAKPREGTLSCAHYPVTPRRDTALEVLT